MGALLEGFAQVILWQFWVPSPTLLSPLTHRKARHRTKPMRYGKWQMDESVLQTSWGVADYYLTPATADGRALLEERWDRDAPNPSS